MWSEGDCPSADDDDVVLCKSMEVQSNVNHVYAGVLTGIIITT